MNWSQKGYPLVQIVVMYAITSIASSSLIIHSGSQIAHLHGRGQSSRDVPASLGATVHFIYEIASPIKWHLRAIHLQVSKIKHEAIHSPSIECVATCFTIQKPPIVQGRCRPRTQSGTHLSDHGGVHQSAVHVPQDSNRVVFDRNLNHPRTRHRFHRDKAMGYRIQSKTNQSNSSFRLVLVEGSCHPPWLADPAIPSKPVHAPCIMRRINIDHRNERQPTS